MRTDADGRYSYAVPAGPSWVIRFAYKASRDDQTFASTSDVTLRVAAKARLRVTPGRVRNGRAVTFRGSCWAVTCRAGGARRSPGQAGWMADVRSRSRDPADASPSATASPGPSGRRPTPSAPRCAGRGGALRGGAVQPLEGGGPVGGDEYGAIPMRLCSFSRAARRVFACAALRASAAAPAAAEGPSPTAQARAAYAESWPTVDPCPSRVRSVSGHGVDPNPDTTGVVLRTAIEADRGGRGQDEARHEDGDGYGRRRERLGTVGVGRRCGSCRCGRAVGMESPVGTI